MPTNRETAEFYTDPVDPELRELGHKRNQNDFDRALGVEQPTNDASPQSRRAAQQPADPGPTGSDKTPPFGKGGLADG
jgi:hypothetical protein